MGILAQSVRQAFNPKALNLADIPAAFFTSNPSATGIDVTEESSIQSSAVFRCVSILAGVVASLPCGIFEATPDGSEPVPNDDLQPVLDDSPSEALGSYTFRHLSVTSYLLYGNAYSRISRRRRRDVAAPVEFLFLPPSAIDVELKKSRLSYNYTPTNGSKETFDQRNIFHVPGLGFDGLKGKSVIETAGKEPLGLAFAMERMLGKLHANAARPSGVVTMPDNLKPEALKNLKKAFSELAEGLDNTGRTVFLDAGGKWEPMTINPVDLETLAARRFQVADIARLFGVPLFLLAETEKSTSWGSGLEEQTAAFVRYTIRPLLVAFEQEYTRKLRALNLLKRTRFVQFDLNGLLRGDSKTRAEVYGSGIQNGWMKPNEARRRENLPPDEAGDVLYANGTLQPLGSAPANPPPTTEE